MNRNAQGRLKGGRLGRVPLWSRRLLRGYRVGVEHPVTPKATAIGMNALGRHWGNSARCPVFDQDHVGDGEHG